MAALWPALWRTSSGCTAPTRRRSTWPPGPAPGPARRPSSTRCTPSAPWCGCSGCAGRCSWCPVDLVPVDPGRLHRPDRRADAAGPGPAGGGVRYRRGRGELAQGGGRGHGARAGRPRQRDRRRTRPGRAAAARPDRLRRGQELRRPGERHHQAAHAAVGRGPHRARPPARRVDLQPVHLVRRAGSAPAAGRRPFPAPGPSWRAAGCTRSAPPRGPTCSGGPAGRPGRSSRRWISWRSPRSTSTGPPGVMLAADEDAPPAAGPWAALLPALDPTAMGWRDRAWYVGEHAPALFDRSGNIGPTAWWDGRIVGGWAQRKDGEIAVRLLEDAGAEASAAIAAEAQRSASGSGAKTRRSGSPRASAPRWNASWRAQPPEHRRRSREPPVAGRALPGDPRRGVRQERRQLPAERRAGPRAAGPAPHRAARVAAGPPWPGPRAGRG